MLRLTRVTHGDSAVTLIVEGRIVAEWGDFLARECADLKKGGRAVCLDLSAVKYVDARGADHLRRLASSGVQLSGISDLLAQLLEENGHG